MNQLIQRPIDERAQQSVLAGVTTMQHQHGGEPQAWFLSYSFLYQVSFGSGYWCYDRALLSLAGDLAYSSIDQNAANHGYPAMLCMDNGPEFIQPGKPTQNAFIGRFNRTYSTEILDFYLFRTLSEVWEITEKWLSEYNCKRPHESLNSMKPEEYRQHHY